MASVTSEKLQLSGNVIGDGRYEVRSKLGEGNMGLVYLANDSRLGTDVVLKVPTAAALTDAEFVERFQREIRSLVKLTHPHIVTVLDVGKHDTVPYVVLQYLAGKSLRDRQVDPQRRQKPMPPSSLKEWLLNIAKALDFIHTQGYIHRDVKPANILFDHHGNAFLSDFGLAKVLSSTTEAKQDASLTGAGFLVGTPNYIAPELIMGQQADGRVDQYSLAMTVYESLAGKVPVEGPSASATMVNQTRMKIPPLSEYVESISDELSDVVLRGLSKNPAKRFASCTEFAEEVLLVTSLGGRVAQAAVSSGISGKISRGQAGRVPCPNCGKILPLKPQFAGKKARCAKCLSLLLIGPDIATLKLVELPREPEPEMPDLPEAPRMRSRASQKFATDTVRGESSQTQKNRLSNSGEVDELLGEEVFGYRISRQLVAGIAGGMVLVLMAVAIFIGMQSTAPDRARDAEKKKMDLMTDREKKQYLEQQAKGLDAIAPAPSGSGAAAAPAVPKKASSRE